MKRYTFTTPFMNTRPKLVCIESDEDAYHVGDIYDIALTHSYSYYYVYNKEVRQRWCVEYLNDVDAGVKMYPLTKLSDKEIFLLKLAGRLPDGH